LEEVAGLGDAEGGDAPGGGEAGGREADAGEGAEAEAGVAGELGEGRQVGEVEAEGFFDGPPALGGEADGGFVAGRFFGAGGEAGEQLIQKGEAFERASGGGGGAAVPEAGEGVDLPDLGGAGGADAAGVGRREEGGGDEVEAEEAPGGLEDAALDRFHLMVPDEAAGAEELAAVVGVLLDLAAEDEVEEVAGGADGAEGVGFGPLEGLDEEDAAQGGIEETGGEACVHGLIQRRVGRKCDIIRRPPRRHRDGARGRLAG